MSRFRKEGKKETPELNMGSMSDITFNDASRMVVITMKKNRNMKMMSDMEPMLSSGVSFFPSFLNLDIIVRFKGYLPLLL